MSGNKENDRKKTGKVECDKNISAEIKSCKNVPVVNVTHPLRYYEFTQDELKALEECDKESFYQRCIPFSAIFATSTYAAIKKGILTANPHLGAMTKVSLAILVGHFYGRYAYIPHCEEKLRELPKNSHLGNVMRNYYCERMKMRKAMYSK